MSLFDVAVLHETLSDMQGAKNMFIFEWFFSLAGEKKNLIIYSTNWFHPMRWKEGICMQILYQNTRLKYKWSWGWVGLTFIFFTGKKHLLVKFHDQNMYILFWDVVDGDMFFWKRWEWLTSMFKCLLTACNDEWRFYYNQCIDTNGIK